MILLEPDVALTDFGLAIECACMAAWLYWRVPTRSALCRWFAIFFAALGVSALLGGITHGFLPETQSTIYGIVWRATLLAIGVAAFSSWAIGAGLLFSKGVAKGVLVFAALLFVMYVVTVLILSQSFTIAIIYYLPAASFLLVSFVLTYLRRRRTYLVVGVAGLVLSFVAAGIQHTETGIVSLSLSHNAFYHLVQAVALVMIFWAAWGLSREVACEQDATS